uniref:ARAD1A05148p n=1 Tax=Blastobotrys adeninivorans TaxID=409370 RepID=A0A060T2Z8_BLAAD
MVIKYSGPHKPSLEFTHVLHHLFPDVGEERANVFFRYDGQKDFLKEFRNYLKDYEFPSPYNGTILVENGAEIEGELEKEILVMGLEGKRSTLYNAYCFTVPSDLHKQVVGAIKVAFAETLARNPLMALGIL